ncbi:Hypothetical protein NTJ_12067 [Nesidiocoris tenuis]|uniref:DUF4794 domain-containing protein n=1 Tax=Nesidiocoris tenuis TaxID=355587 RepID=A0ABN7B4C3_9HEMI|nr:Hypothetical protein NTJ_12067 [Nesidiocoris tenuis]
MSKITMLQAIAFAVALVGTASGAPNHLKTVSVDKQVVVNGGGGYDGNLGASASWGPFAAGAGLGGGPNGGQAFAGAFAPGVNAGAGYGGGASASSSASASASADGGSNFGVAPATGSGGTLFDQIFNIPISILKSVNQYANNKETVPGAHKRLRKCRRRGICDDNEGIVGGVSGGVAVAAEGKKVAMATEGSQAGVEAGSHSEAQSGGVAAVGVRKNYDNAFAIPIAALTSVNQLLNGIIPISF